MLVQAAFMHYIRKRTWPLLTCFYFFLSYWFSLTSGILGSWIIIGTNVLTQQDGICKNHWSIENAIQKWRKLILNNISIWSLPLRNFCNINGNSEGRMSQRFALHWSETKMMMNNVLLLYWELESVRWIFSAFIK